MSEGSSASRAEWVNEELRDYKGFRDILSLLEHSVGGPSASQPLGTDHGGMAIPRAGDDERSAREAAFFNALLARSEVADLVQHIQQLDEERRSRALKVLFGSSTTENPKKE
jgi:hypothetical protein